MVKRSYIAIGLIIVLLIIAGTLSYANLLKPTTITTTVTKTIVETKKYTITTVRTTVTAYTVTTTLTSTRTLTQTEMITTTATITKKYPLTIIDALGRSVTIKHIPSRVVSLAPSITEMLFALGLGKYVIGVDTFSNYPPEVVKLKKEGKIADIGNFWNPDIEKIIKLKPDLVVADAGAHAKILEKFEELKLPVIYVHGGAATNAEDITKDIMLLGLIFNTLDSAQRLVSEIRSQINYVVTKLNNANASKVKVLILLGPPSMGLWSTGSGTFINYLIEVAGGANILSKYHSWIQVGYEEIVKGNPDVIIITVMGTKETAQKIIEELEKTPLASTNAVKNHKVYVLIGEADDIITRPSPRIIEALNMLAKILHPEIFGEIARDDVIQG